MFSRKGDSAVGFIMRCKVLAHVGFVNLANEVRDQRWLSLSLHTQWE